MSEETVETQSTDIGRQQIAAVYAKAFLAAAEKSGKASDRVEQLQSLVTDVLKPNPQFEKVLSSPRLKPEEKIGLIDRTLGSKLTKEVGQFLRVIANHDRLDCIRDICTAVRQQFNESQGIAEVQIMSANPLSSGLIKQIQSALKSQLGQEVSLDQKTDPDLIGGLVIRIGDKVYDGSVRQKLATLRQETVDKTVQQMRDAGDRFSASQ